MPGNDDAYVLVDAGAGRRLDRFGRVLVDRPAPGMTDPPRLRADTWERADGTFERERGWRWRGRPPEDWTVAIDGLVLELRPAESGQVGVFSEHAQSWAWLQERSGDRDVLNLFAYTGATTLALARVGTRVVHLDAARTAVSWARRNATRNGLGEAAIRWLVDDALAFTAREVRRGRRYAGIVLDPPSYGHAPGRRAWRLDADLEGLVAACARLLDPPGFLHLTSHTPSYGPDRLASLLDVHLTPGAEAGRLGLEAASGAWLPLGAWARWQGGR